MESGFWSRMMWMPMKKHESSLNTGMKKPGRYDRGFTIIEVIVVLIVLGIITAVIISRASSTATYTLRSEADVIKTHIRYAQARAMNTSTVWGINFPSSTTYSLFRNGDTTDTVVLPGVDSDPVTLPSGVTVSTGIVSFNDWGSPYANATATGTSTNVTITVTCDETESISITKNTGFIP